MSSSNPSKKELWNKIKVYLIFTLLITLVLVTYLFNRIFITIYPGYCGVYWRRFGGGTDLNYIYTEGLHIIPPWNKMYIYDVRIHHQPFSFDALSKDGLRIRFEVSALFYPDKKYLPQLHTQIGPNYIKKVVEPEIQAQLRKVVANYYPEEIYTSEGYLLQIIRQGAMAVLAAKHIVLDDLLIRRMILPPSLVRAIERKLVQKQRVMEYKYRLESEMKEAKRKIIEAEGIKKFEEIVSSGHFFQQYLQFKGIDATLALAKSNNSKIVIIGGAGRGGLPVIFNLDLETGSSSPLPHLKKNSLFNNSLKKPTKKVKKGIRKSCSKNGTATKVFSPQLLKHVEDYLNTYKKTITEGITLPFKKETK